MNWLTKLRRTFVGWTKAEAMAYVQLRDRRTHEPEKIIKAVQYAAFKWSLSRRDEQDLTRLWHARLSNLQAGIQAGIRGTCSIDAVKLTYLFKSLERSCTPVTLYYQRPESGGGLGRWGAHALCVVGLFTTYYWVDIRTSCPQAYATDWFSQQYGVKFWTEGEYDTILDRQNEQEEIAFLESRRKK